MEQLTARTDRLFSNIEEALSLAGQMIDSYEEEYEGEREDAREVVGKGLIALALLRIHETSVVENSSTEVDEK